MGMNATQKILAAHAGRDSVKAGELISADVDLMLGNDITAPVAISQMEKVGDKVKDPDKIIFVMDHFVPCKDIKSAEQCKTVRNYAKKQGIKKFYDVGISGVEHALLPELGVIIPSSLIIGADSHTCTYGAFNCFSTGVGSTDLAAAMLTGKTWFKVPSAIKIQLSGKLNPFVTGKDFVLTLIGALGVNGATYKSLEFCGDISALSVDERMTIANMAVECGAKNAIFPLDGIAIEYLISVGAVKDKKEAEELSITPDPDAEYDLELSFDLGQILPTVAFPDLPDNVRYFGIDDMSNIKVDQVVIGSCTNGRISDMRQAAEILKDKKVHKNVRCIIIPATPKVYRECLEEGLTKIFVDAGAVVSTPTCGPCLGGYMGILASGETAVSTTNRNFVGRMGDPTSKIYLSSPYVAAQSAINGFLSSPTEAKL